MGIAECRESYSCYIPLTEQEYLIFPLVLWPFQSKVHGPLSSVRHGISWSRP